MVHNTGNQNTNTDIQPSSTNDNTRLCNNAQNEEEKRNIQNKNMINLKLSNITKWELVREDTCNTMTNPYMQQKVAFLDRIYQKKTYRESAAFFIGQNGEHAGLF